MYEFNPEVPHLTNGVAISCSTGHPGSVAFLSIIRGNSEWHEMETEKRDASRTSFKSFDKRLDTFINHWSVLGAKGYIGSQNDFRAIFPENKPANRCLTSQDTLRVQRISNSSLNSENVFQVLSSFGLFSKKWR